jgi:hypothetical protein
MSYAYSIQEKRKVSDWYNALLNIMILNIDRHLCFIIRMGMYAMKLGVFIFNLETLLFIKTVYADGFS